MATPTARQVVIPDEAPAFFRPINQTMLVPSQASNPAASQSFLPGVGEVRIGNSLTDNGLYPAENKKLAAAVQFERANRRAAAGPTALQDRAKAVEATIQKAQRAGKALTTAQVQQIQAEQALLARKVQDSKKQRAIDVKASETRNTPPWMKKTMILNTSTRTMRGRAISPAGVGAEITQAQLVAAGQPAPTAPTGPVTNNTTGVTGVVAKLKIWMQGKTAGIPNWAVAAAGGGLVLSLILKRKG
jgi:hypothetical protein